LSQSPIRELTLEELVTGARLLLDLGCGPQSPARHLPAAVVIGLDEQFHPNITVQAQAQKLPFRADSFDAIIANHTFEHFPDLNASLSEAARVLKPNGLLYIAVPFSTTFSDKLYRALFQGGGHIQDFQSAQHVISLVESLTGLRCAAQTPIYSAFHFLTGPDIQGLPRRIRLWLRFWTPTLTAMLVFLLSCLERCGWNNARLYGGSFVFASNREPFVLEPRHYTCCRCGANFSRLWLQGHSAFSQYKLLTRFQCTNCGRQNSLA
jgi:SAM-dependent methyltransferase